jgi:myo-inositol-1(or 4)-monophosphatase
MQSARPLRVFDAVRGAYPFAIVNRDFEKRAAMTIDIDTCAMLLRAATDQIATTTERPAATADIVDVIVWVKAKSAAAASSLRKQLADLYPDIGWTGEEDRPDDPEATYWVYDPIDGAYHFLQGLPLWSSSLAVVRGGRCLVGIIYDATSNEMFIAREDHGATLNGSPIRTQNKSALASAVLGTAVPPILQVGFSEHAEALYLLGQVSREVFVVRQMASASLQLAYVASGRLDGYFEVGHDIPDWLAGALLVKEAGGRVTDLNGEAFGWNSDGLLAASANMHHALRPLVAPKPAQTLSHA